VHARVLAFTDQRDPSKILEEEALTEAASYNRHRPHRALGLEPPAPSTGLTWSARLGEPGCADATSLVVCFTSTGELHERNYAPYGGLLSRLRDVFRAEALVCLGRWLRRVLT
jgi:hypothetical protein